MRLSGARQLSRERWNGARLSRWQIGLAALLVLVTLTGATFLVSWAPHAGGSAATHLSASPANGVATGGLAAIPPPVTPTATASPRPTATSRPPLTTTLGELCHDSYMFVPHIVEWTVPPGCYATIYTPNPAAYPSRPGFGYCNWWVRERHLAHPDITENTSYPRGSKPVAGAAVFFAPNVQGASPAGHWSQVVAVAPGGYWFLVSEMNFAWRGGGFGKVDYRYAHAGSGVTFVYA
jgi:hypothetical protein